MEPKIEGWEKWVCGTSLIFFLIALGGGIYASSIHEKELADLMMSSLWIFAPALFISVFVMSAVQSLRRRRFNYAWYRSTNPQAIDSQGNICCRSCKSSAVSIQNLMNRTFMRAHICGQCGTTLFYSEEQ